MIEIILTSYLIFLALGIWLGWELGYYNGRFVGR